MITAIATDWSIRDGEAYQAPPSESTPNADLERYADRPLTDVSDYKEIIEAMGAAPLGACGIVVVNDRSGEISHAFNVLRDHNGVVFLDGQTGQQAAGPADPVRLRFLPTSVEAPATENPLSVEEAAAAALPIPGGFFLPGQRHEVDSAREAAEHLPYVGGMVTVSGPLTEDDGGGVRLGGLSPQRLAQWLADKHPGGVRGVLLPLPGTDAKLPDWASAYASQLRDALVGLRMPAGVLAAVVGWARSTGYDLLLQAGDAALSVPRPVDQWEWYPPDEEPLVPLGESLARAAARLGYPIIPGTDSSFE